MHNITPRPVGAALKADNLAYYRDWLIAGQRDLEVQDACVPEVLDGDWAAVTRQITSVLDGHTGRRGIHGPFMSLTLLARDPKIRAVVQDRFKQALDFGAEIRATHMVIHSPFIYLGNHFLPHAPSQGLADQIELVQETLAPIVPLAEQAACTLVIEDILDRNTGPLLALISSFESDFVRLSIDTGHAFIAHQHGGPPPDHWVLEAGTMLAHVHLQDSDGLVDRHWVPGDGNLNWYALFEALSSLEQQPRLVLELRDQQEVLRGHRWLVEQGFAL